MAYVDVQVELRDHVATITLDRPGQMNAVTPEMAESIATAIGVVGRDDEARVLVIAGAGRAFCAGGDFKAMGAGAEREQSASGRFAALQASQKRIPLLLQQLHKPVIAAVNGAAMGWGCDLAIACDIRIAADTARFAELFVRRGLIPDGGSTYHLPRLIGMDRAAEIIFTGRIVDAAEAFRCGLVTRVVPHASLSEAVGDLAREIAANAPLAVQTAKRLLYAQLNMTLEQALEQSAMFHMALRASEDHQEGVRAFVERREPQFRGV